MENKVLVTRSSMPPYEEYTEMIKKLWDSHWLTNMGEYHNQLEKELIDFLKVPKVSLMSNGHMALEMAIQAMNLPAGSEVITTAFTFVSTTHAIVRNGLKPVFCDITMDDYTIDVSKIEDLITENTSAIIPVHVYGNLCNVDEIQRIADKYRLKVIYDAAHAFGVEKDGIGVGNFGDASIFSFHATKVFNTIEGGAVTFNNADIGEKLYNLKNFGIRSEEIVVDVGANAKMNEFQAAMGICNLRHFEEEIEKRKKVIECYEENLCRNDGIRLMERKENVKSNFAYFPILVEKEGKRDYIYSALKAENIYSRKYFYPLTSDQACFKNKYKNVKLDNARYVSNRILVLPLYADLKVDEIEKICRIVNQTIGEGI